MQKSQVMEEDESLGSNSTNVTEGQVLDVQDALSRQFQNPQLLGKNPDGSVRIRYTDPATNEEIDDVLDLPDAIRRSGMDPNSLEIEYNSPDTSVPESELDFGDRFKLALLSQDTKSQYDYLTKKFGKENVQETVDGEFTVKKDGVWTTAQGGFKETLLANTPEIAAGIASKAVSSSVGAATFGTIGALAGGLVGTYLFPGVGTLAGVGYGARVGTWLGATAFSAGAATLATGIKNKGLEVMGIKNEQDAKEASEILGREFAWNMAFDVAFQGILPVAKGVGSAAHTVVDSGPVRAVGKGVSKMSKALYGDNVARLGQFLAARVRGTDALDWATTARSAEDAKGVLKYMDQYQAWQKKVASGLKNITDTIDPVTKNLVDTTRAVMKGAKQTAQKTYGKMWQTLEDARVIDKREISAHQIAAEYRSKLASMGILSKDKVTGELIIDAELPQVKEIFDKSSVDVMNDVLRQLDKIVRPEQIVKGSAATGEVIRIPERLMSFREARSLIGGIDDVLEASGFYRNGAAANSSKARQALFELRKGLSSSAETGLRKFNVVVDGKNIADHYAEGAARYSKFRSIYDEIGEIGETNEQAIRAVNQVIKSKGPGRLADIHEMAQAAGVSDGAYHYIAEISRMRAGRNLAPYSTGREGFGGIVSDVIGYTPENIARGLAEGTEQAMAKASPVSKMSRDQLSTLAHGVDWVKRVGAKTVSEVVNNPQAAAQFYQAWDEVPVNTRNVSDQMFGGSQ